MFISAHVIDLLNNGLSALVLDQLDNMAALLLYNWLKTNYNSLTTKPEYMIAKSSSQVELVIGYPVYFLISLFFVIYFITISSLDNESFFLSNDENNKPLIYLAQLSIYVAGMLMIVMFIFLGFMCLKNK